ncbi:MAG: nuclear transport factor 2 family protein [Deltaproteobacteria bacterium]|nr:nuclear transport factor 2 family protein [Deltaproteobacteria bacterium]
MRKLVATLVFIALVFVAHRYLMPDDDGQIRDRLAALARAATVARELSPLEVAARANEAQGYVTSTAVIELKPLEGAARKIEGREGLRLAIAAAALRFHLLTVSFLDVKTEISPDRRSATAYATARARSEAEKWEEVIELKFSLEKENGVWLISRAENHESLERR